MSHRSGFVLLAIRGTLAPKTIEEARNIHNNTAGNDQGVAAAKALGDLSHNVYVPFADTGSKASELLILDVWNDPAGLQKFFSDPKVQAGGGMIFSSRDPAVWTPAEECASFSLPTPKGRDERFVGVLRANVKSRAAAAEAFNAMVGGSTNTARKHGQVSHDVFFRMTPPGEPSSLELIGIDTWMDGAGMTAFYGDKNHMAPLGAALAGPPVTSVWRQPPGTWVEW